MTGMDALDWDREYLWRFRARLVSVTDGDTIVVLSDTGYRGRQEVALRIFGIDAPKMSTPEGKMAAHWLASTLLWGRYGFSPWLLRVKTIQRETVVTEVTSFERWVSRVWVVGEGGRLVDVAEALVKAGHATPALREAQPNTT